MHSSTSSVVAPLKSTDAVPVKLVVPDAVPAPVLS
jgi:hypothetical protein